MIIDLKYNQKHYKKFNKINILHNKIQIKAKMIWIIYKKNNKHKIRPRINICYKYKNAMLVKN